MATLETTMDGGSSTQVQCWRMPDGSSQIRVRVPHNNSAEDESRDWLRNSKYTFDADSGCWTYTQAPGVDPQDVLLETSRVLSMTCATPELFSGMDLDLDLGVLDDEVLNRKATVSLDDASQGLPPSALVQLSPDVSQLTATTSPVPQQPHQQPHQQPADAAVQPLEQQLDGPWQPQQHQEEEPLVWQASNTTASPVWQPQLLPQHAMARHASDPLPSHLSAASLARPMMQQPNHQPAMMAQQASEPLARQLSSRQTSSASTMDGVAFGGTMFNQEHSWGSAATAGPALDQFVPCSPAMGSNPFSGQRVRASWSSMPPPPSAAAPMGAEGSPVCVPSLGPRHMSAPPVPMSGHDIIYREHIHGVMVTVLDNGRMRLEGAPLQAVRLQLANLFGMAPPRCGCAPGRCAATSLMAPATAAAVAPSCPLLPPAVAYDSPPWYTGQEVRYVIATLMHREPALVRCADQLRPLPEGQGWTFPPRFRPRDATGRPMAGPLEYVSGRQHNIGRLYFLSETPGAQVQGGFLWADGTEPYGPEAMRRFELAKAAEPASPATAYMCPTRASPPTCATDADVAASNAAVEAPIC